MSSLRGTSSLGLGAATAPHPREPPTAPHPRGPPTAPHPRDPPTAPHPRGLPEHHTPGASHSITPQDLLQLLDPHSHSTPRSLSFTLTVAVMFQLELGYRLVPPPPPPGGDPPSWSVPRMSYFRSPSLPPLPPACRPPPIARPPRRPLLSPEPTSVEHTSRAQPRHTHTHTCGRAHAHTHTVPQPPLAPAWGASPCTFP